MYSGAVHVIALALLIIGFHSAYRPLGDSYPEYNTVKATVIDSSTLKKMSSKPAPVKKKPVKTPPPQQIKKKQQPPKVAKREAQIQPKVEKKQQLKEKDKKSELERMTKMLLQEEQELENMEIEETPNLTPAQRRAFDRQMSQYKDAIIARIQSRWHKPTSARYGQECRRYVRQTPGGFIEGVDVGQCTGDDAFRRSVEAAVWKSEPLPAPPDAALFDRNLHIIFRHQQE